MAETLQVLDALDVPIAHTHLEHDAFAECIEAHRPDVTIIGETRLGRLAGSRQWKALCKLPGRRVLWFWDLRTPVEAAAHHLAGAVDLTATSFLEDGGYSLQAWRSVTGGGTAYAPQAGATHVPVFDKAQGHRCIFIGDVTNRKFHADRAQLCRELKCTTLNASDRDARRAMEQRMTCLYPSSDYCLSVSPRVQGYTSVRTNKILACGGALLLRRFPLAERLFEHGTHALMFDGAAEARQLMEKWDRSPERRRALAERGRRLHAERHTMAHRVLNLAANALGISEEFWGWL